MTLPPCTTLLRLEVSLAYKALVFIIFVGLYVDDLCSLDQIVEW